MGNGHGQNSSSAPNLSNMINNLNSRKTSNSSFTPVYQPVEINNRMNDYAQQEISRPTNAVNNSNDMLGHYPGPHQNHQNNQVHLGANSYGLSQIEFSFIGSYFSSISGIDQQLDRQEFQMLIAKLYPQLTGNKLHEVSNRAFTSINKSGNGFISIDEFIAAYLNLKKNQTDF